MSNIILQRIGNQQLLQPEFQTPREVAAWMGAVQSQDYAFAKWALGLRMVGATDDAVEQAFNEGTILRTHLMRPTWHFVTPDDIRWLLELTAPRVHAFNAHKYRQLELDDVILRQSDIAIAKALQSGRQLTRDELRRVLQKTGIATGPLTAGGEHRLSHILMHAELDGLICSGPRRGRQFTYMLLDERVPHAKTLTRDEALAELARRYFTSHGPATSKDFAWWSGLTMADAKATLAILGSQLSHETINDQTYWFSSISPSVKEKMVTAQLLPALDEYTVAYKERNTLFDTRLSQPGDLGEFFTKHLILLAGKIVGTWQRILKKDAVVFNIQLLTILTAAEQRAVDAAVQRYSHFLELPAVISD